MPSDPVLVVSDLTRRFRSVEAVSGLSLHVDPGEVLGILGPNGSGKSTTMKVLAGVLRPTEGQVHVSGVDAVAAPLEAKRLTGYVPDVGGLFPRLTGWEHLELASRVWGLRAWEGRSKYLLERLDLADAGGRRASTYSHGMSRKLSVAISLLARPRLLLLDEPFDGVDPSGSLTIRELLAEELAEGAAALVSTHLLDVAEKLCDRVIVIRSGSIIASGAPHEVAGPDSTLEEGYLALLRPPR